MSRRRLSCLFRFLFICLMVSVLTGCVVRTYPVIKQRVDQDISQGNRGYLYGRPPASENVTSRKKTRKTYAVEIELSNPFKFETLPEDGKTEDVAAGDPVLPPEIYAAPEASARGVVNIPRISQEPLAEDEFSLYTVQKGDTLQKISRRFYGTTKRWQYLYEANEDILKGPDKVYPGQEIRVPRE
ncbi:MAG: LysM peptidoglycan-binding domain-containing protein [Candidatus Omnitrophota bacterium]